MVACGLALAHAPVPPSPRRLAHEQAHPPIHRQPSGVQGDAPSPSHTPLSTGAQEDLGLRLGIADATWPLHLARPSPLELKEILVEAQGDVSLSAGA